MSITAVTRKSLTDLTRRRARAFFTVLTLALAVASVGLFAINPLMDQAMKHEVSANQLPDVTVSMKPLALTNAELARLGRLPNVTALEPRSLFATRVYVGARRDKALIVGVPDFAHQQADVVALDSGSAPTSGTLLVDRNDSTHTKFHAGIGGFARVLSATGRVESLRITGVGRNLTGADRVVSGYITFYADLHTVSQLSGTTGYTSLGFRLRDNSRPAAERTVAAVRAELRATTSFRAFDDMPVIQDPGGYPGKSEFEKLGGMFTIITLLALLTALVLVSNTMSTVIGEQTGEIAAMKAIGARRRDIRRLYLRTTLLFGVLGAARGRDPRGRVREPPRWVLRRSRVRDQRAVGGVGADRDREPHRRADRSAARGASRPSVEPPVCRWPRRFTPPAPRLVDRAGWMRCSGASRHFRAQRRSGFAESVDVSAAVLQRCCRSDSPLARSSRCSPSVQGSARPRPSGMTRTTSTSGSKPSRASRSMPMHSDWSAPPRACPRFKQE